MLTEPQGGLETRANLIFEIERKKARLPVVLQKRKEEEEVH